jgi:hypothetical protein
MVLLGQMVSTALVGRLYLYLQLMKITGCPQIKVPMELMELVVLAAAAAAAAAVKDVSFVLMELVALAAAAAAAVKAVKLVKAAMVLDELLHFTQLVAMGMQLIILTISQQ